MLRVYGPVVSYKGIPLYKLSKYVPGILSTYMQKEGYTFNKFNVFSKNVRTLHIDDDKAMTSFYVTSLYVNVPILDSLTIIEDLFKKHENYHQKNKNTKSRVN